MENLGVTAEDKSLFEPYAREIDYDALDGLHLLGNYMRELPVNIKRMMENAYDWEHLPFVHPSSFAKIAKISSGAWGWRAKVELPGTGEEQLLQLLVDNARGYWATTVLSGTGKGVHIHTQATPISNDAITIDVRFYLEQPFEDDAANQMVLGHLQTLYAQLYDEDQELMQGRQAALDFRELPENDGATEIDLGDEAQLKDELPKQFELGGTKFCLNQWQGEWVIYGATCPHLLGPLADAEIGQDGAVTCPWHGYRFDVNTGQNIDGKCGDLAAVPTLSEQDGHLIASF